MGVYMAELERIIEYLKLLIEMSSRDRSKDMLSYLMSMALVEAEDELRRRIER